MKCTCEKDAEKEKANDGNSYYTSCYECHDITCDNCKVFVPQEKDGLPAGKWALHKECAKKYKDKPIQWKLRK